MKKTKFLTLLILLILVINNGCKKEESLVDSIKLDKKVLLLKIDDTELITVSVSPSSYDLKKINWKSSNPDVATINNSGVLTAIKPGETLITVNPDGNNISDTCFVTVVNIINYTTSDGLLSNSVSTIATDSIGNTWFGTYKGVSKFDGTTWTSFTESDGLVNNGINCIVIDAQNNIWFGTQGGVSKFDGTNWTSYTTSNGLANDRVDAIVFDNMGNKWFGTYNGLSKFDGINWTTFTTSNGLIGSENWVFDLVVDKINNNIWAITWDGVSIYDGISWSDYSHYEHLTSTIYGISIDRYNNKWLATIDGIFKFNGTNWVKQFNNSDYLLSYAHEILFDKHDFIWFTTREGIYKYDGKNISTFTGDNYTMINKTEIRNINIDNKENIWIAKTFEGVYKLETK